MNNELLQASIALTEWLRSTGKTNKSRAGRVPAKLLEQLESAIVHAQQSVYVDAAIQPPAEVDSSLNIVPANVAGSQPRQ